jgi:hypothetical protein
MIAQVSLTPTESKKLTAKAIARMELVERAAEEGVIVIYPSSSTYSPAEELTGENPKYDNRVCGSITPKGLCVEHRQRRIKVGGYTMGHIVNRPELVKGITACLYG